MSNIDDCSLLGSQSSAIVCANQTATNNHACWHSDCSLAFWLCFNQILEWLLSPAMLRSYLLVVVHWNCHCLSSKQIAPLSNFHNCRYEWPDRVRPNLYSCHTLPVVSITVSISILLQSLSRFDIGHLTLVERKHLLHSYVKLLLAVFAIAFLSAWSLGICEILN